METFLTYGVERLNKTEREMKEAEIYRETKVRFYSNPSPHLLLL